MTTMKKTALPRGTLFLVIASLAPCALRAQQASAVEGLLRSKARVSYAAVRNLPAGADAELRATLRDAGAGRALPRAVTMLGYLGDVAAVPELLAFLAAVDGHPAAAVEAAVLALPEALGRLANAGSASALDTLVSLHETGGPVLAWDLGAPPAAAAFRLRLAEATDRGLALVASDIADQRLQKSLAAHPAADDLERHRSLQQAVALAARVRAQGLDAVSSQQDRVLLLVERQYPRGVPYAAARALGADAVPDLCNLLVDTASEELWPNAVVCLGYLAEPVGADALLKFLRTNRGEVGPVALRALLLAVPALGHSARVGNKAALDFLVTYATRAGEALPFRHGSYADEKQVAALQKLAIQGLGFSGLSAAEEVLRRVVQQPDFPAHLEDNIAEARGYIERLQSSTPETVFGGQ